MASAPGSVFDVRRNARGVSSGRVLGYRSYQVHRFVEEYTSEHGREPSYSRICDELGIATKGEVSVIVRRLAVRGIVSLRYEGVRSYKGVSSRERELYPKIRLVAKR